MADEATYPYTMQDAQNASNPLYIHPNESPSTILASPLLSDGNYHSWSRAMKMSLLTKNKLGFVDGTIAEPPKNHAVLPFWERGNMLVLSWLIKSMSVEIAQSILWREKASDVWKELHEHVSHADLFRISEIQEEIFNQRQGDNFVSKFYTALKTLWDELDVLNPLPQFATENASVPKALLVVGDDTSNSKRNQGSGNGWNNRYTSKKCSWCGKMGHIVDICYRKHDFPAGFKFKNSKNNAPRSANMLMAKKNETNCPNDSSRKDTQGDAWFHYKKNVK
ncbi:uncharacterized protein LOC114368257 [Glycine soja]|uniref:uncharacterized protein LOC114368257 n=1 Tax=Glycine soja TaxID=3848 RepID=UPI001039DEC1|nr:uncharacterized protein LOC114368257 [Glycine soja]